MICVREEYVYIMQPVMGRENCSCWFNWQKQAESKHHVNNIHIFIFMAAVIYF
jgi:hypothetical protein